MRTANILDPIHDSLPASVWDHPAAPEPKLKPVHSDFIKSNIYKILEQNGYTQPHEWLKLYLTGSLCTYQYGPGSDCDVSLFVDSTVFPEWSRAEMIGLMIENTEHLKLPGTPYPLQAYVVAKSLHPSDLYKPHIRSGYDIDQNKWLVPPDPSMAHDPRVQDNGFYVWALEKADSMERLLRYEPRKAELLWHQIHARRALDERLGKGDMSEANLVYKMLHKRGLVPQIAALTGEHIASERTAMPYGMFWTPDGREMTLDGRKVRYLDVIEVYPDSGQVILLDQRGQQYITDIDTWNRLTGGRELTLEERQSWEEQQSPEEQRTASVWDEPSGEAAYWDQTYNPSVPSTEWYPGMEGKGFFDFGGQPHVWAVNTMGQPFHDEYANEHAVEGIHSPIEIAPSGHYTTAYGWEDPDISETYPKGWESDFASKVPGLKYVPSYGMFRKNMDRGRYGKTSSTIAALVLHGITSNGGITIGLNGKQPKAEGYALSMAKDAEVQVPLKQISAHMIDEYVAQHMTELAQPGNYLGAWVSNGVVFLDVSHIEFDLNKAMAKARAADQLAVYDLANDHDIPIERDGQTIASMKIAWHPMTYMKQIEPVAQAYNNLPEFDSNAVKAWDALKQESAEHANRVRQQLNVTVTDNPELYPHAQAMTNDIRNGNFAVSRAFSEHPLWTPEENVNFRITHDVLGHYPSGGDFSWQGENLACGAHSNVLSPLAQEALRTECLGQTGAAIYNGGFGTQKVGFIPSTFQPVTTASIPGSFCHRHIRHGIYRLGNR